MRFLSLNLIEGPLCEPVTLAQAKSHLRVDFDDDDAYISGLITAAREWCEAYTHRHIFNQTWQRTLDYFPVWAGGTTVNPSNREDWMFFSDYWSKVMIQLPGRINAINSISYELPNGGGTVVLDPADYVADLTSIPARIVPQQGMTWPVQELYVPGSVTINYTAGSYIQQVTETFTVPGQSPYTYTPLQSPLTGIVSITIGGADAQNAGYGEGGYGDGGYGGGTSQTTPAYTVSDGVVTFTSASAGQSASITYWAGRCPAAIQQAMLLLIGFWYQHSLAAPSPGLKPTPVDLPVQALLAVHKVEAFYVS